MLKMYALCLLNILFFTNVLCKDVLMFPTGGTMSPYRLPNSTMPKLYNIILTIDPNFDQHFSGSVKIIVRALCPTNTIVLHSKNLELNTVIVKVPRGRDNLCIGWTHSTNDTDFLELHLKESLTVDFDYVILIEYIGHYSEKDRGFFIGSYEDDDDITRYYATSHLPPCGARSGFPCYDEPALKAIFRVQIYSPKGFTSISNMEELISKLPKKKGFVATTFKVTPPMSSYLVHFLVSDFKSKSNVIDGPMIHPKNYTVYARPNAYDCTDFALVTGQKILKAMEDYTNSTYPLNKMGLAAIPNLPVLAMENYGLISFLESKILVNESTTTTFDKIRTTTLICHETTHMWFGNKVTPVWWDYYWMSEGFANFFQYYMVDMMNDREWRLMDHFVVLVMQVIMNQDSLAHVQPMTNPVYKKSDIRRNMMRISYDKGASVIRMMSYVLGEDAFHQGLIRYINDPSNNLTNPKKLYSALQVHEYCVGFLPCRTRVEEVFDSWSSQAGYPLLMTYRSTDGGMLTITQSRYHVNSYIKSDEKWWIPLTWCTNSDMDFENTNIQAWLSPDLPHKLIQINRNDKWFIFNIQQIGYFRVMYPVENWVNLICALKSPDFDGIHYLNRAQLIDDTFDFALTFRMTYGMALDLISYLQYEMDYIPWISAFRGFVFMDKIMPESDYYNLYKKFSLGLIQGSYDALGFKCNSDDDYISKLHRFKALDMACNAGCADCISKSNDILNCLMSNGDCCVDPDINPIIYCYGLKHGTEDQWDFVFNKYIEEKSSIERGKLISSLACTESPKIIQRYLNMIFDDNCGLRKAERAIVLNYVIISGPIGIREALKFVIRNFESLKERIHDGTIGIINAFGNYIVNSDDYEKFKHFSVLYKSIFTPDETDAVNNSIVTIENQICWLNIAMEQIDTWLLKNVN